MYPRNAASPEPIAIGPVVQISDGAVQSSGVTVRIKPVGVAEADGGGTTAYSTDGVVLYTPTQAETNYTSFVLIAKKTGCIPASVTVVTTASGTAGYAGVDWSKITAATSTVALTNTTINASQVVASVSGAVGSVTSRVTANTDQWGGVAVTGMPLPTASYTAPPSAATNATAVRSELATELGRMDAAVSSRSTLTAAGVRTELATELGRIDATISSRLATSGYTAPDNATIGTISTNLATVNNNVLSRLAASAYVAPDNTSITAVKAVTDKLNTTLVVDGLVWKYTVNALSNAPGGGGGGSATIENQQLILANLDNITGAVSAAVARLQLETQITGFPATICRGSDYDQTLESEIRLQLLDLENNPITEIGGTPVDEITWLFGLGTDRQPRLVAGACSWDDTTDELVIELAAGDTDTTPLGSVTWQIGAQIGELVRWLGGGTTRIVERQFAA